MESLQTAVTFIFTQFGTIADKIASTPILLVGVGVFIGNVHFYIVGVVCV